MRKLLLIIAVLGGLMACNKTETFNSPDEMVAQASKDLQTITVEELKT